jgi:hypothetical protein
MHDDAENLATEYEHKKHGLQVTEAIYKPRTLNHLTSLVHEKIDMSAALHGKQAAVTFFLKHSTNADIYTCMSTHPYKYMHAHLTLMSTSEN